MPRLQRGVVPPGTEREISPDSARTLNSALIDEVRMIAVYPVETEPTVEKYIREHGAELHEFARKIRECHFRRAV